MEEKMKEEKNTQPKIMEKLVSLAKRRGFIFPGSEIYGGLANTWDYGPLGVELKNNIKNNWWDHFVHRRDDIYGVDAAILMNTKVWDASGHLDKFSDPMIDCRDCKERFAADKLVDRVYKEQKGEEIVSTGWPDEKIQNLIEELKIKCPNCKNSDWTPIRYFNLMFKTYQGVIEDESTIVYLRPETAQGIFVNFRNVLNSTRVRLPFGIAQIGKAFRNEITPGNFTYRTREFEQMEIEYFLRKEDVEKQFKEWKKEMTNWILSLGLKKKNLRWRQHEDSELSHYSTKTFDLEYRFPFGWGELFGFAYRTDFDLKNHMEYSGKDMRYTDPEKGNKFIPHVIEPSFGVERPLLAILIDAYCEEEVRGEKRVVLRLSPKMAPIKIAVFPLVRTDSALAKIAREIFKNLGQKFVCKYDALGSIGRRYRRHDEVGTPFAITCDSDTIKDNTVTVRDRDTMEQERVNIEDLEGYFVSNLL